MRSRKDTLKAFLVEGAKFVGKYDFPQVSTTCQELPQGLIPFEKCRKSLERNQWIHFYQHDYTFECVWNRPEYYLSLFQNYSGVITPDFSLYRDYPLGEQIHNTYRSRAIGYYLNRHNIPIIPNVRWGNEQSYEFCFEGIDKSSIVAIGTHGCIQGEENRYYFKKGLNEMIQVLSPHTIIVYGYAPEDIFSSARLSGINILSFDNYFVQICKRRNK